MSISGCSRRPGAEWGSRLVACGGTMIQIVDAERSAVDTSVVLWSIDSSELAKQLPPEFKDYMIAFDECKPVDGGRKLLVCSSGHCTLLIDTLSRRVEFYAFTPMAHSAELLPPGDSIGARRNRRHVVSRTMDSTRLSGRVVVANSTEPRGNSIELYDLSQSNVRLWRDTMYYAHGVVWSEKYQSLYALGFNELRRYELADWDTSSPRLELMETFDLPLDRGHDLVPMDKDHFLITCSGGPSIFDLKQCSFSTFEPLVDTMYVKSVNYNSHLDRLIFTKAPDDKVWWNDEIYIVDGACAAIAAGDSLHTSVSSRRAIAVDPDMFCYKTRVL